MRFMYSCPSLPGIAKHHYGNGVYETYLTPDGYVMGMTLTSKRKHDALSSRMKFWRNSVKGQMSQCLSCFLAFRKQMQKYEEYFNRQKNNYPCREKGLSLHGKTEGVVCE